MGKIPFTVSARTARLIGQENFANAEGAVIELVKNSYDADADKCIVCINTLDDCLYIIDNGDGMSEDKIRKHWMIMGTDDKLLDFKTVTQRVKTGAKGIGRFAIDRLGKCCEMTTKTEKDVPIFWSVNWADFEKKDAVISDIEANIDQLQKVNFIELIKEILKDFNLNDDLINSWSTNKGTIIKINGLKDIWDDKSVDSLFSNLEILIPPSDKKIFSVILCSTEFPEKYGEVKSAICDDYDYKITAEVVEDKKLKITVFRNELDFNELRSIGLFESDLLTDPLYSMETFEKGQYEIDRTYDQLLAGFKEVDVNNNLDKIGPFTFHFYFMKRGGGQEKDEGVGKFPYKAVNYRDRATWLDRFGGVKIFRDNFRVRPYGEPKSSSFDWLDLGKQALSNPTVTRPGYKVRSQQVYGLVNISRIGNINFDDKSSREGLQENDAFVLFKEMLREIISIFENDRNQIMIALKKISDEKKKKEKAKADAEDIIKKQKKGRPVNTADNSQILIEAIEAYKEEIEDLIDEQKLLRVLASAGLIVTSFAHEFKNLSDNIVPRTDDLKSVLNNIIDNDSIKKLPDYLNPYTLISDMRTQDVRLKSWLDFALASVRKDKRTRKTINMVAYIEGLERMWSSLLSRRHIKLVVDKKNFVEVNFRGHEIDLDGIFNNLMANSVDAFRRPDAPDLREIKLSFLFDMNTGINVTYEDSGPGLSPEIIDPNQIFQPFFTTKRDERTGEKIGTGLGMWIVKTTLDEYEGKIEFIKTRPGYKIKIILPYK
jgi:signal transduction histidine kinase